MSARGLALDVTALALYSSVKQYYSKLIKSDGAPSSQE